MDAHIRYIITTIDRGSKRLADVHRRVDAATQQQAKKLRELNRAHAEGTVAVDRHGKALHGHALAARVAALHGVRLNDVLDRQGRVLAGAALQARLNALQNRKLAQTYESVRRGASGTTAITEKYVAASKKATQANREQAASAQSTARQLSGLQIRYAQAANAVDRYVSSARRVLGINRQSGKEARGLSSNFGSLDRALSTLNTRFAAVRNVLRTLRFPVAAAGAAFLLGGLASLTAGVVALTSALAPLAGALVALPAAFATAAQGAAAFRLATFGIEEAVKAMADAQTSAGKDAQAYADRQEAAADRVQNAERALVEAREESQEAQEALTEAHRLARRELEDLKFAAEDAAFSQRRASLTLREARQELVRTTQDPGASQLERDQARLAYDEAVAGVRRTREERQRAAAELTRGQRAGIAGSETMRNAQERVADAAQNLTSATRELARAQRDAQRAQSELGGGADRVQEAFARLNPESARFARFIFSLQPRLRQLQRTAARGLLPGAEEGIRSAMRNFPVFNRAIGLTSRTMGGLARQAGRLIGSRGFGRDFGLVARTNAANLGRAGRTAMNFGNALRHVLVAARPFLTWLGRATERWSLFVSRQARAGRESGKLARFFEQTRLVMQGVARIGGNVAGALANIGRAARPLGRVLLRAMEDVSERWKELTDSPRGQRGLRQYFEDARRPIFEVAGLIGDLSGMFFRLAASKGFAELVSTVRRDLLPVLEEVLVIAGGPLGKALVDLAVAFLQMFRAMEGPLEFVVRGFAKFIHILSTGVREVAPFRWLLTGLLTTLLAIRAVQFTGHILGVTKLYETYKKFREGTSWINTLGSTGKKAGSSFVHHFRRAMTGLKNVLTTAATNAAGWFSNTFPGAWSRRSSKVSDPIRSTVRNAGRAGGTLAATSAAANIATDLPTAIDKPTRASKFRRAGGKLGRYIGRGVGIGLLLSIPFVLDDLRKLIDAIEEKVKSGGNQFPGPDPGSGPGIIDFNTLLDQIGSLGRRAGGRIRRFAAGGLVPAAVSSGELLRFPDGRGMVVPGAPVAADNVFMGLPSGTEVYTGHGQRLLAAGFSRQTALAQQMPHFARGGRVREGRYTSTAYGPPWNRMNGTGVTRTGIDLRPARQRYIVAVDPGWISLGSRVHAWPNPFGRRNIVFQAEDTGGAIKGRRLDFYDWRGRRSQLGWGRRNVDVTWARGSRVTPPLRRGGAGGGGARTIGLDALSPARASAMLPQLVRGFRPEEQGFFERAMEGASPRDLLRGITGAARIPLVAPPRRPGGTSDPARQGGGLRAGGGWGGTQNLVMQAIAGIPGRKSFKRAANHPLSISNPSSDHNTANRNAFAADISPGSDGLFARIARRLRIPARKGSWNQFANRPLPGFRSQLLWYAPDGSHRDHIHLGIKRLRRGGVVGRYQGGGAVRGQVRALAGAASGANVGGILANLQAMLSSAVDAQIMAIYLSVQRQIRVLLRGGATRRERVQIHRLRAVLSLLEAEAGGRVGRVLQTIEEARAGLERQRTRFDQGLRLRQIDQATAAGQQALAGFLQAQHMALEKQQQQLRGALALARRTGATPETIRGIEEQLRGVQDELAENFAQIIEAQRAAVAARAQEAVDVAAFGVGQAQGRLGQVDARGRLAQAYPATVASDRAGIIQGSVLPALQSQFQALNSQLGALQSINAPQEQIRSVLEAIQGVEGEILSNMVAYHDAMLERASAIVEAAERHTGFKQLEFQRLELQQRLAGTFDSTAGQTARATFIREQIIPSLHNEVDALKAQLNTAREHGDPTLAEQIAQAIYAKENEILQAQLEAQEQIAQNTDGLRELTGSVAFEFSGQRFTDLIGVGTGV